MLSNKTGVEEGEGGLFYFFFFFQGGGCLEGSWVLSLWEAMSVLECVFFSFFPFLIKLSLSTSFLGGVLFLLCPAVGRGTSNGEAGTWP